MRLKRLKSFVSQMTCSVDMVQRVFKVSIKSGLRESCAVDYVSNP